MEHGQSFRRAQSHGNIRVDGMLRRPTEINPEAMQSIRNKFAKNYFGLPPYSMQQTSSALAYQCRKPLDRADEGEEDEDESTSKITEKTEKIDITHRKTHEIIEHRGDAYAQRKVASALLIMARNPLMRKHFLSKGGYDAALKLLSESKDQEVLHYCGQCLMQVSLFEENARVVVEKGVFNGISYLCESNEETLRLMASVVIAWLSSAPNMDELLVMHSALMYIQSLMTHCHRPDAICHLLLA